MEALAETTGVPVPQLEGLVKGQVGAGVASRLGTSAFVLQDFVDGEVKPAVATLLGLPLEQAEALRNELGRAGAIGLILGMVLRSA